MTWHSFFILLENSREHHLSLRVPFFSNDLFSRGEKNNWMWLESNPGHPVQQANANSIFTPLPLGPCLWSTETTFVVTIVVVAVVVVNFVASNDMFWGEKNQTGFSRFLSSYQNVVNVGVVKDVNIGCRCRLFISTGRSQKSVRRPIDARSNWIFFSSQDPEVFCFYRSQVFRWNLQKLKIF